MKCCLISALCLSLLLFFLDTSYPQTEAKWYSLKENQHYVTDFVLKAGETKTCIIQSDRTIWVGFISDATDEQSKKYLPFLDPINRIWSPARLPIKLSEPEGGVYLYSLSRGATLFPPTDGKIVISLTNESQETFKIVVYTEIPEGMHYEWKGQ